MQDTWCYDDDDYELHDYLIKNNIYYEILPREDILALPLENIRVIYADTDIINKITNYTPPDTYPSVFNEFYKRRIVKSTIKKCKLFTFPFFIKPISNNKLFTGKVVYNKKDLKEYDDNLLVYVCDYVKYKNEYRIFIENYKAVYSVETSHYLLNTKDIESIEPPRSFVKKVVNSNIYPYVIIDIGMIDTGEWTVVEVNPPYSISSYGIDIEDYFRYCQNAWDFISSR